MLIISYKAERNQKNKFKKRLQASKHKFHKKRSHKVSKTNSQHLSKIKRKSHAVNNKNNLLCKNMLTHISKVISKRFKAKENK
jgi:hypothetical protein